MKFNTVYNCNYDVCMLPHSVYNRDCKTGDWYEVINGEDIEVTDELEIEELDEAWYNFGKNGEKDGM